MRGMMRLLFDAHWCRHEHTYCRMIEYRIELYVLPGYYTYHNSMFVYCIYLLSGRENPTELIFDWLISQLVDLFCSRLQLIGPRRPTPVAVTKKESESKQEYRKGVRVANEMETIIIGKRSRVSD